MKLYRVVAKTEDHTDIEAENQEDLMKKLSTGHYSILPIRANQTVSLVPENVKEIIELKSDFSKQD